MTIIACITFGHSTAEVAEALSGAVEYATATEGVRIVALDDSSGDPPDAIDGVEMWTTPTRMGFAAAVNYLSAQGGPSLKRLVLVNPDTSPTMDTCNLLVQTDAVVAVPPIIERGEVLENIRTITTAGVQLRALWLGDRFAGAERAVPLGSRVISCPPLAPTGTVVSIDGAALRSVQFEPKLFWLEFSDWVLRWTRERGELRVAIVGEPVGHVGASTAVSYPVSVAASQALSKTTFVARHGTRWQKTLAPLGAVLFGLRFGVRHRDVRGTVRVALAGIGVLDWRVAR